MTKREEQPNAALFKDISNFKTPKRPPKPPTHQSPYTSSLFRTAKQTPGSTSTLQRRRSQSLLPSTAKSKSKAARRLKEIELEISQSSRKAQVQKERSLKSLSNSLTAWLNYLFENPRGCGVDVKRNELGNGNGNGKRDSLEGGVGVDEEWRNPKRFRDYAWISVNENGEVLNVKMFPTLRDSLKDVCSFDDLLLRMRGYLSLDSCKDIFNVMIKVTKAIDEGRMKMKAHCPLVTDIGMKEKAALTLLCYNPIWLRIGLYILFGGDSLLTNGNVNSADQENDLLKLVIEKQFFSHAGLAKVYAYNKNVEGMYRPGYFEELGTVILKRFLLLVLILDRAKSQRTLPLKFGIDGIDGGSPLLFNMKSDVKASRQMVNEFLSTNVMHGEGNLLAHLEMVRYKVSYQQEPLLEYHFRISDLFEDLQDGVLICRAIQLLQQESSILLKLAVPSDTHKKKLSNCGVALEYLKQGSVPLHDDDGVSIISDDIAQGDKELTLSLLWNIFVHLQIPLLINNSLFLEEIARIRGTVHDTSITGTAAPLALLLSWVQVVCEKYDCRVDDFTSLVDGKVMWCLLDYYFRKELHCSCAYKDLGESTVAESIVLTSEYTDGVHNFILSQKLTSLLGNFPEVLQISDILEYNGVCNEKSVMILLVFLSSELIVKRNMDQLNFHKLMGCTSRTVDRKRSTSEHLCPIKYSPLIQSLRSVENDDFAKHFREIREWWQDITQQKHQRGDKFDIILENDLLDSTENEKNTVQIENAARVIQSIIRQFIARQKYLKIKGATSYLQMAIRAWLAARNKYIRRCGALKATIERFPGSDQNYSVFLDERHKFVTFKRSALLIQRSVRTWISHKYRTRTAYIAASTIQRSFCGMLARKNLRIQRNAIIAIQREQLKAAIIIQSQFRRWIAQKDYHTRRDLVIIIQSYVRCWLTRRRFSRKRKSAVKIQSVWHAHKMRAMFICYQRAVTKIQCVVRGHIIRKRLLGSSLNHIGSFKLGTMKSSSISLRSIELEQVVRSIIKIQRWWRNVSLHKLEKDMAIVIQAHVRGWLARRHVVREKSQIVIIQSCWKGYLARKGSKQNLVDLRLRVKNSAANIDDSKRLMNRLLAALAELLNMKSVRNILHTCETLDTATKHSQKCCEELVAAGAIDTLLKLIQSVSRSIPDQEVLKYALSTLRNLARYPHLSKAIISASRSLEIIFLEMLRNKEDAYFIAAELMKKICYIPEGIKAVRCLPGFVKRLHSHTEDLRRKINFEKRTSRANLAPKEAMEKRYHEALEILKIATSSR